MLSKNDKTLIVLPVLPLLGYQVDSQSVLPSYFDKRKEIDAITSQVGTLGAFGAMGAF